MEMSCDARYASTGRAKGSACMHQHQQAALACISTNTQCLHASAPSGKSEGLAPGHGLDCDTAWDRQRLRGPNGTEESHRTCGGLNSNHDPCSCMSDDGALSPSKAFRALTGITIAERLHETEQG